MGAEISCSKKWWKRSGNCFCKPANQKTSSRMAWTTSRVGELLLSPGKRVTCPVLRFDTAQSIGLRIGSRNRSRPSFLKIAPRSTLLSRMMFEVRKDSFQNRLLIFCFRVSTPAFSRRSLV